MARRWPAGHSHVHAPATVSFSTHTYHQYTLRLDSEQRDAVRQKLADAGIPSMIYYPCPLHLQAAYQSLGYKKGDFPVSEFLAQSVLSLPMHTELTEEQIQYIVQNLI